MNQLILKRGNSMKFESGRMYTHRNMLDVGFFVYDSMVKPEGVSLLVQWLNIRSKCVIDVREDIFVANHQICNYSEVFLDLK